MKNLFSVIPADFFKPMCGKYREQYADCLLLIFNSYKAEISYGADREDVVSTLTEYFNGRDDAISFDDDATFEKDSRTKAQGTINYLKNCGWLELEDAPNYRQNVLLTENAAVFIEAMARAVNREETEFQGYISSIYAMLQNSELYAKPYQLIIKKAYSEVSQLTSSLKKLSISIKKHLDRQTKKLDMRQVLEMFAAYNAEIVSKALYRLKTSENISRFRQTIRARLDEMLYNDGLMQTMAEEYAEIEGEKDISAAKEKSIAIINEIKNAFERLDLIVNDIDRKNRLYLRNAAARAKFELSADSNQEGKINAVLRCLAESNVAEYANEEIAAAFQMFPQRFVSEESIRKLPEKRNYGEVAAAAEANVLSAEEREKLRRQLMERQQRRIYRKKIEAFVMQALAGRKSMSASEIPVRSREDFEKIIYIRLFAAGSKTYSIKNKTENDENAMPRRIRAVMPCCEFNDFEIIACHA
ncbi:MAG: hypothetical protein J5706_01075 [Elusimicrobiales bacterium]|nr:hypothetical protein [Elusimicrobiales bacterium]